MELGLSLGQENEHDFFEFVQQVCYDTGNALLEYGHHPRPQILHVKIKARQHSPETYDSDKKKVCSRCVMALGRVGPDPS